MKALALTLLIATSAHAGVIATAPTQAGGYIYLTDEKSGCPGSSNGYAVSGFGDAKFEAFGCYIISGGSVTRRDASNNQFDDPTGRYTMTPYGTAKTAKMKREAM